MKIEVNKGRISYFFILSLFLLGYLWIVIAGSLNEFFCNTLSSYSIIIQGLKVPFCGIVIAPIDEEIVKFFGYAIIYLIGIGLINALGYNSKKEFRNDYMIIFFLFSAGGFGFYEGVIKNSIFGSLSFIAFISLNTLAHITYSIYPYILGRRYKNMFIIFLPVAMLLHSVHNFVIGNMWDNKWVTFTMVTALLLPIIVMERKNFYKIVERLFFDKFKNPKKANFVLSILFIFLYIYIFLCVWLRFL